MDEINRANTLEKRLQIIAAEADPERKCVYPLCWLPGASQSDLARPAIMDINWDERVVALATAASVLEFVHPHFVADGAGLTDHDISSPCTISSSADRQPRTFFRADHAANFFVLRVNEIASLEKSHFFRFQDVQKPLSGGSISIPFVNGYRFKQPV